MQRTKLVFTVLFLLLIVAPCIHAQGKKVTKPADTTNFPYWIQMMDDTSVVFAEAERAFNIYWKNRITPQNDNEESEMEGGFEGEGRDNIKYGYEYKRFRAWEQKARNLVGPDGRLISPRRQIEIWEQNHKERNEK